MKITADTNVLVRALTGDDERQSKIAQTDEESRTGRAGYDRAVMRQGEIS
jgi:predicted nucleic-acid-binding protein